MAERPLVDRLDDAIQATLASIEASVDHELEPYVSIARTLRDLPRPSFRTRLKADLQKGTNMTVATEPLTAVRQTATPRLRVKNAAAAIEFYKAAFGARELMRFTGHGRIAHAELAIGNSIVMLGEAAAEYGFPSPEALGGSPVGMHLYASVTIGDSVVEMGEARGPYQPMPTMFYLYVPNVDASYRRALEAGASSLSQPTDQPYGDRTAGVKDAFGNQWYLATQLRETR
jgi:uncharacterized glyoxalase superfamily protein PhnB